MKTNSELNTLPIKINDIATRFDILLRKKDEDTYLQIQALSREISTILDSIEVDIENDNSSLMHYRMLLNMHQYIQEHVEKLSVNQQFTSESYADVKYIKSLFPYMNSLSQLLIMSYLEYSSNEYASIMENIKEKQATINLVLISLGLISILFALMVSRDIFRTLGELSRNAKLLADGEWHIPDIKQNNYQELDYVANAFNKMKEYIIMYMNQLRNKAEIERQLHNQKLLTVEKEKLLKESQLRNLQMQMNPHFLFNTLNMIGRTAMLEDNETTVKLIESISVMLRFNLESEGKLVPLKEELKALHGYLFIQEMRFQDRLSICINETDNIDDFLIPPMSLQPIVENCLIHGLNGSVTEGKIDIDIKVHENYAQIAISDNGKGIGKEKLDKIFLASYEDDVEQKKNSIGLVNVRKRLELSFGKGNLLQIDSTVNSGTTVQIILPKEKIKSEGIA